MAHTTVSVTKGMGIAAVGGRGGVALCWGGKGWRVELRRVAVRVACREMCDRVARSTDLVMGSMIDMYLYV